MAENAVDCWQPWSNHDALPTIDWNAGLFAIAAVSALNAVVPRRNTEVPVSTTESANWDDAIGTVVWLTVIEVRSTA